MTAPRVQLIPGYMQEVGWKAALKGRKIKAIITSPPCWPSVQNKSKLGSLGRHSVELKKKKDTPTLSLGGESDAAQWARAVEDCLMILRPYVATGYLLVLQQMEEGEDRKGRYQGGLGYLVWRLAYDWELLGEAAVAEVRPDTRIKGLPDTRIGAMDTRKQANDTRIDEEDGSWRAHAPTAERTSRRSSRTTQAISADQRSTPDGPRRRAASPRSRRSSRLLASSTGSTTTQGATRSKARASDVRQAAAHADVIASASELIGIRRTLIFGTQKDAYACVYPVDCWAVPAPGEHDGWPCSSYEEAATFIELSTRRGDLVVDPFMGTGTTGQAAVDLGRSFIGVEACATSFDVATTRIRAAQVSGRRSASIRRGRG